MRTLDVDGRVYLEINGKTFFLIRGYEGKRYDTFCFIQVHGTAALTKDDLPEKSWEIVVTKKDGKKVYTAYKPDFFNGKNDLQLFIAATEQAAIVRLIRHDHPDLTPDEAARVAEAAKGHLYSAGISEQADKGNAKVSAFSLGHSYGRGLHTFIEETLHPKEQT